MGSTNNQYTQDVVNNGLSAVDSRRKSYSFDMSNQDQALNYLLQSGYSQTQPLNGDQYTNWQSQRFGGDPNAQIAYGQTPGGKYAGFKTLGDLKAATLGFGEAQRQMDQSKAGDLANLAQQYLDQSASMYGDASSMMASQARAKLDPSVQMDPLQQNAVVHDKVAPQAHDLNNWLAQTTSPYQDALQTASQIQHTPLRQYAQLSAQHYGIDPNIVAGWYPTASAVTDFRNQRDLNAIDNYGMPNSDFQSYQTHQDALGQLQQKDYLKGQTQAQVDQNSQNLGFDAAQISQATNMTQDQLGAVIADPHFHETQAQIVDALSNPDPAMTQDLRAKAVVQAFQNASADPNLVSLLRALYGSQLTAAQAAIAASGG